MEKLLDAVFRVSKVLNDIAAGALTLMIATTVVDVFLRAVGHPVVGAYEIVGLICGPLVIGFAVPLSSWNKNHVSMDILLAKLAKGNRDVLNVTTRIICILLFGFIGYNLFSVGTEFCSAGEVSQTLHLPFYWVTYGVGGCCFIECSVFICDILKIWREEA
ncbi:MAG: TRAP transporter small permease [Syntrophorhabdales bacterium]|jgi:TRAP-type C4-dicarboxylate transport system permease small subunit